MTLISAAFPLTMNTSDRIFECYIFFNYSQRIKYHRGHTSPVLPSATALSQGISVISILFKWNSNATIKGNVTIMRKDVISKIWNHLFSKLNRFWICEFCELSNKKQTFCQSELSNDSKSHKFSFCWLLLVSNGLCSFLCLRSDSCTDFTKTVNAT